MNHNPHVWGTNGWRWMRDPASLVVRRRLPHEILIGAPRCPACALDAEPSGPTEDPFPRAALPRTLCVEGHLFTFAHLQVTWERAMRDALVALARIECYVGAGCLSHLDGDARLAFEDFVDAVPQVQRHALLADERVCPTCMLGVPASGFEGREVTSCPFGHSFIVDEVIRTWEQFFEEARVALLHSTNAVSQCQMHHNVNWRLWDVAANFDDALLYASGAMGSGRAMYADPATW